MYVYTPSSTARAGIGCADCGGRCHSGVGDVTLQFPYVTDSGMSAGDVGNALLAPLQTLPTTVPWVVGGLAALFVLHSLFSDKGTKRRNSRKYAKERARLDAQHSYREAKRAARRKHPLFAVPRFA